MKLMQRFSVAGLRAKLNPEARSVLDEITDKQEKRRVARMVALEPAFFMNHNQKGREENNGRKS